MACKECGGLGTIERDERMFECTCERNLRIAASMDAHFRKAAFNDGHLKHPLVKMAGESCFVISSWADIKAIIKLTIIQNWPKFIKTTSDREIRDVYVGDRSKKAHAEDFQGKVYNTLEELMSPPDLMIVRLNELSYKNIAAPGALEEALSYRLDRMRPTWVLSDLDRPFGPGCHAYSEHVVELLHSTCKKIMVPRILPRATLDPQAFAVPAEMSPSPPAEEELIQVGSGLSKSKKPFGRNDAPPPVQRRPPPKPDVSDDDEFLNTLGQGIAPSKKFQKRGP